MSDTTATATPTETATPAPVPTVPASPRFVAAITAFAAKLGYDYNTVIGILTDQAVNDMSDASLDILCSPVDVDNTMWASMFGAVKRPVLNNAVNALRASAAPVAATPTAAAAPSVATAASAAVAATVFRGLTPLADDRTFLNSLTIGGRLNGTVGPQDAVNAVRVAMADSIGLYDVPERLADLIEDFSNTMETPADERVYVLLNTIRERRYAEVLEPLGVTTRAVTDARRKDFMGRLQKTLWPGLRRFHIALKGWYEGWAAQGQNPGMMANMMLAMVSGGQGLIPGMMQAPDVGVLRSAHAELVTMTNRLYAGAYMIPVSRAMAFDAIKIVGQLNDLGLAAAAGVPNRDELLRRLRVGVTDAYARSERAIAQYVLNALQMDVQTDADLPPFAAALYMLGNTIDWDVLGTPRVSGDASLQEERPVSSRRREVVTREAPQFSPYPRDPQR